MHRQLQLGAEAVLTPKLKPVASSIGTCHVTARRSGETRTLIGTENMWPLLMTRAWQEEGVLMRVSCERVGLRYVPKAEGYW